LRKAQNATLIKNNIFVNFLGRALGAVALIALHRFFVIILLAKKSVMGNVISAPATTQRSQGENEGQVCDQQNEKGIMKKFLSMSALALTVAALSTQEAPAWINSKFGVGLNWGWQSAGNNLGWGFFRNGQPPAPDTCPGVGGPVYPAPAMPHGMQQPSSTEHGGVTAGVDLSAPVNGGTTGQTQSLRGQPWSNQTVNYPYRPAYPYYGGYGYSNYGYGYGYGR
jgi:hypothetical protein